MHNTHPIEVRSLISAAEHEVHIFADFKKKIINCTILNIKLTIRREEERNVNSKKKKKKTQHVSGP